MTRPLWQVTKTHKQTPKNKRNNRAKGKQNSVQTKRCPLQLERLGPINMRGASARLTPFSASSGLHAHFSSYSSFPIRICTQCHYMRHPEQFLHV